MVVTGTVGCRRGSAEERAAAKAIDACIAALGPVADDRPPPADVLADARADAEEAARTDDHWEGLAAALRRAEEAAGAAGGDAAVAALVEECKRSRDFVRRGGREPRQA